MSTFVSVLAYTFNISDKIAVHVGIVEGRLHLRKATALLPIPNFLQERKSG
jgi:hypothetical protein